MLSLFGESKRCGYLRKAADAKQSPQRLDFAGTKQQNRLPSAFVPMGACQERRLKN